MRVYLTTFLSLLDALLKNNQLTLLSLDHCMKTALPILLGLSLFPTFLTAEDDITFFFQAEDGIRDLVRSRGLGDVYKRQGEGRIRTPAGDKTPLLKSCLLYTSDAADE